MKDYSGLCFLSKAQIYDPFPELLQVHLLAVRAQTTTIVQHLSATCAHAVAADKSKSQSFWLNQNKFEVILN